MVIPQRETEATKGWWISGFPWRRWSQTCDLSFITNFSYFLIFYFPCNLTLSASNYYVHCDWTEHAVICRIVSNLSLLAYGRTYFTMICLKRKNVCKSGVLSFTRLFSIKCNLGYQSCPGYELFLIFWKMVETKKQQKQTRTKKYIFLLKSQDAEKK